MVCDRLDEFNAFVNDLYVNRLTGLSFEQIQNEYKWNRRKVERMLTKVREKYGNSLCDEYIYEGTAHYKVFRLVKKDIQTLSQSFITASELASLRTARKMLRNHTQLSSNLKSVADKLANLDDNASIDADYLMDSTGTVSAPGPRIKIDKKIFQKLQDAILTFNQIQITYRGKVSKMCPLGILHGRNNDYLVAANENHLDSPIRYILGHIADVEILDDTFSVPDGFDIQQYSNQSFGAWFDGKVYDVEWRADKSVADVARTFKFHPTQSEPVENPDGSITIKFRAGDLNAMAWHLFTWGGKIVPIAPRELKKTYQKWIDLAQKSLKK